MGVAMGATMIAVAEVGMGVVMSVVPCGVMFFVKDVVTIFFMGVITGCQGCCHRGCHGSFYKCYPTCCHEFFQGCCHWCCHHGSCHRVFKGVVTAVVMGVVKGAIMGVVSCHGVVKDIVMGFDMGVITNVMVGVVLYCPCPALFLCRM